jgi:hypothetical protein
MDVEKPQTLFQGVQTMVDIETVIRQLSANAAAIQALVESLSSDQAQWKPDPETWSMQEVMDHVYNEERIDFRKHLIEMLSDPPQPWGAFRREEYLATGDCRQALDAFLNEREASIAWLKALHAPDWDVESRATFGPEAEVLVIRAGDVLFSWVAHDYLHIRQINELLYAWNEKLAFPYPVMYAGGW